MTLFPAMALDHFMQKAAFSRSRSGMDSSDCDHGLLLFFLPGVLYSPQPPCRHWQQTVNVIFHRRAVCQHGGGTRLRSGAPLICRCASLPFPSPASRSELTENQSRQCIGGAEKVTENNMTRVAFIIAGGPAGSPGGLQSTLAKYHV